MPRERRFDLPALAIDPAMTRALRLRSESSDHLSPIAGPRPFAALAPAVERDDGGPDAEGVPTVAVVGFAVECGIGQDPIPRDHQGRLGHDRAELRGVVGRAGGDGCPGEEVAGRVDGDGELGPESRGVLAARPFEEVARGVAALQAGAVDGGGRRRADQAAIRCGRSGAGEEADDLPFFKSRFSA